MAFRKCIHVLDGSSKYLQSSTKVMDYEPMYGAKGSIQVGLVDTKPAETPMTF